MEIDKLALRAELLAQLREMLATARVAYASAVEGATHAEAKAENDKDTRGLEQSYIARGQAQRVLDLEAAVHEVGRMELRACAVVGMSAVVAVDEDGEAQRYFLAPHGGGNVLAGGVLVITLSSPLGKALFGKRADDEIELKIAGKTRDVTVISVI